MVETGMKFGKLTDLATLMEEGRTEKKWCICRDLNGNVPMFAQYKADLHDTYKSYMKALISQDEKGYDEAAESLRAQMVWSMRKGETLVINWDKTIPDLKDKMKSDVLDYDKLFDRAWWTADFNYRGWVKEDEKVDLLGNKQSVFWASDNFHIVIVTSLEDEADFQNFLTAIPHSDKMLQFTVN